jgi:hypothetical protein
MTGQVGSSPMSQATRWAHPKPEKTTAIRQTCRTASERGRGIGAQTTQVHKEEVACLMECETAMLSELFVDHR